MLSEIDAYLFLAADAERAAAKAQDSFGRTLWLKLAEKYRAQAGNNMVELSRMPKEDEMQL
jgi:hypothetical protein